jgi:amino acid adenylation domain-containing protein
VSYLLHELLRSSARAAPGRVAVVDGDRQITYAELDALSNQIANLLVEKGVRKGDRVGIYLRKSMEAVAGVYGIMKAGAAYVPLDPEAPVDRIAYILSNCDIRVLVTAAEKSGEWSHLVEMTPLESILSLDADSDWQTLDIGGATLFLPSDVAAKSSSEPEVRVLDLDLALLLYTSGSTGNPKGVMLSHLNVITFVEWAVEEFGVAEDDRLSQVAPLHFDLSTFDLYGAARAGASVHLAPRQTSMFPMEMRKFIEAHEISVMYAVPSALTMLTERAKLTSGDLPDLRTILFAGEVFPTKYLSRIMTLLPHTLFSNLYGPTETNVCTYYTLPGPPPEDGPPISIGKAITNVETFVVKDDGSIAAPGELGELHVRGASVMQGYWGDPERTAGSRIENPFSEGLSDPVYKTGDLVIEEPDGNYTFLGRRDNQIKSRGYRIELGEIETALYAHPDIRECAAVAIPDELVTNRIKAYVVAGHGLDARSLTRFLGEHIPKYMVPGEFEFRDMLPKTSTGKIDRQSLLKTSQVKESQ